MTKRKAEDALEPAASTPCPAHRNAHVQPATGLPPVLHCQPTDDSTQFQLCMLGRCNHCRVCMECNTRRQLKWQNDHHLRTKLSSRNAVLHEQAAVYDRLAPSFTRDHEAHDQIFVLQDKLQALQEQIDQMQQALPTNTSTGHSAETETAQPYGPTNDAILSEGGVRKYESDPEDRHVANNFHSGLPYDNVALEAEVDDDRYDTAQSTCDDEEANIILKREETPVDEFALIDQIPSSGRYQRRQAIVVIDVEEQLQARRSLEVLQQSEQRAQRHEQRTQRAEREQPLHESTLRTPRPSIEDSQPKAAGSLWTQEEDQKVRRGIKKQLSCKEIHRKYLPHRSAGAIKKRRQKLNKL